MDTVECHLRFINTKFWPGPRFCATFCSCAGYLYCMRDLFWDLVCPGTICTGSLQSLCNSRADPESMFYRKRTLFITFEQKHWQGGYRILEIGGGGGVG